MHELVIAVFIVGYLLIAFEQTVLVNKAATALLTGVACWAVLALWGGGGPAAAGEQLSGHLGEIAGILFFLLGGMTIVEVIDAHAGFDVLTRRIRQTGRRRLLWTLSLLSFCLAAVLGNLTTTIVVISLMRKLVEDETDRLWFAGAVVIATNAGGAWSPIGDVTTAMLWIGGQVSATRIVTGILLPSLACMAVAVLLIGARMRGEVRRPANAPETGAQPLPRGHQMLVLLAGMLVLLLVPVFKAVTHLPPWAGMLAGVAVLWVLTEGLHRVRPAADRQAYSVAGALRRIDTSVILFFLGILLAVAALQSAGVLTATGAWMNARIGNENLINLAIGLFSAVIDNVPLVAAAQGMYGAAQYPPDAPFWQLLSYCTGTGGSILIIGSAAGVAAMSMERIDFWWYLRRIGWIALLAYLAGVGAFLLQARLF
jgi:Na+/H+ antiporter NhaD/arsenite permease-like protein